eukprot:TRINITY_DN56845_c0_g1_i1.p1 TRINITY_DN56845_c0_g1~~TRINITY_DN56845_c0_g1_i1.p1  ORF type:complete len:408 (+),score=104.61 TRINITY_DN56845_c0_g1_i1:19-1242(+)
MLCDCRMMISCRPASGARLLEPGAASPPTLTGASSSFRQRSEQRLAVTRPTCLAAAAAAAAAIASAKKRRGRTSRYSALRTRSSTIGMQKKQRLEVVEARGRSRAIAIIGQDGTGKSRLCAAMMEVNKGLVQPGPAFAEKARLLEQHAEEQNLADGAIESHRHVYSQEPRDDLGSHLHLIDMPRHPERQQLVERALRPAHGAVVVCSVMSGIDSACSSAFAAVKEAGKPAVIFLNSIDKADDPESFDAALDALEQHIGIRPVVLFAPAQVSGMSTGSFLLNVLDGRLCAPNGCSLEEVVNKETVYVPGTLEAWAAGLRQQQIEALCLADSEMREAFVEFEGEVPRLIIEGALHRAVVAGKVMPLVAGSARSGLGVDALQEVLLKFLPSGDNRELIEVEEMLHDWSLF